MDKIKHFIVSAGIVIGANLFVPLWVACLISLAFGIAKELKDKYIDWYDVVADISGIIFAVAIIMIGA